MVVSGKRRGQGEDSIYWDEAKNRYAGALSLGYSRSGTRIRKKVMGWTKTEVREKLRGLHAQVESGVQPRRHYTVNDALDDWLENGLDGLAPSTVTLYRNTIAKALREDLGTVKLTSLTAGAVQKALATMEPLRSAEPAPVSDTEREQAQPAPGQEISQMTAWRHDLEAQPEEFRAALHSRQALKAPIADPGWRGLDALFSAFRTPGQAAILQPPKPTIMPSTRILERSADHDVEPEAGY